MKKLLFQLDTDAIPSVFDTVVAYDGGADHVTPLAGMTPEGCQAAVEGAIYTRPPAEKKNTALFIGGSDMARGDALLAAVRKPFFSGFRVSVMLDSNGGNTTAAAAVALLANSTSLQDKTAVVLAGTGPVGLLDGISSRIHPSTGETQTGDGTASAQSGSTLQLRSMLRSRFLLSR